MRLLSTFLSTGGGKIIVVAALFSVIFSSLATQPMSNALARSDPLTVPIPNAKVSQSSYYAPFGSFKDLFLQESEKHPDFPSYTHFDRELVTDENGHVSAKTMFGRVYISADANGFLQQSTELPLQDGETGNATLTLKRTGAIVGKVYDDSGNPLPGVVIDVKGIATYDEYSRAQKCEIYASDISGYDGTYVVTSGIDPGCEYRIEASVPPYAYYSQSYLNPFLHQQLGESGNTSDLDGLTILKFKVPYQIDDRYKSFLFHSTTIERVKIEQDEATVVDIVMHSVPVGKERFGSISGRVIDIDGNPISDSLVNARAGEEYLEAITDRNGLFSINHVNAGNYTMDVQPLDNLLVVRQVESIVVEEGKNVNVGDIIGERSASIRGRVTLSDGTPAPGLFVDIKPIKLDKGYENYYPCENCIGTYVPDELDQRGTDSQGRYFQEKNLPPGIYEISVNNYELKLGNRMIQLEPATLTLDVHERKEIVDADLVFNYTVIQDYSKLNDTSIRFYGFAKDNEGNLLSGIGVRAHAFVQGYGSIDQQTQTDEDGFYSIYILQKDVPDNKDGLKWTLYVTPTPYSASYNIYYGQIGEDFAIYNLKNDQRQQDVVAYWGDQKRLDYTLQKFTINDILRSNIEVDVKGEPAKYSLPAKRFVLTTGYDDGSKEDVLLMTNSTLTAAWLDTKDNSIVIEIDPIGGTVGAMELVIPKQIATGIGRALFDGQEMTDNEKFQSVRVTENATHTTVSLNYNADFKRIELQGTRVVPEFGGQTIAIIMAVSTMAVLVGARVMRKQLG